MIKSTKILCRYSSFIDKLQPGKSYSNYKMVSVGNSNETSLGYHSFKTLLSFDMKNIDTSKILNAYLSVFIRKVDTAGYSPSSIGLYIGKGLESYDSISWNSLDNAYPSNTISISIPNHITNSFIKINITKLIKNHLNNDDILNVILYPGRYDEEYAVILSSANAQNPPFIELQLNHVDTEIENDNKPAANDIKDIADNTYAALLTKLNSNENMINNMQTSMNVIINSLTKNNEKSSTIYETIKSLSVSINNVNKNLNELNNNMMLLLKQSPSRETSSNNDSLPLDMDKLTQINSKFDSLQSSLDKLIKILSSFSLEPLN